MNNNLIPPFVMKEAGILINNTPKIQTVKASRTNREEDHSIYFPESNFQIPPSLEEMFSYFVTVEPTIYTFSSEAE